MKEQSTSRGFAVLSAAGIIGKIMSVVYVPVLMYILNKDGYAIYYASYQIFVFVYVITTSGIPVAISKLVSEMVSLKNYNAAIRSFKLSRALLLLLGTTMALLTFFLAEPLAHLINNPRSALAIKALSPTILITSVLSSYRGYFQGRGNMTPTAVSQVLEQVINIALSLLGAFLLVKYSLEAGAAGGTVGTTMGAFAAAVYLMFLYERSKRFKLAPGDILDTEVYSNKMLLSKIISYGLPITICVGLQNAGAVIDMSNILGRLQIAGFSEVMRLNLYGSLGQYNTLIGVPITVVTALSVTVLPALSGAAVLKDKKKVQDKINYAFRLCLLVAVPSAIGLAVLSKPIYTFVFTNRFADSYYLMLMGSVVVILMSIVQIQTTVLQSLGKLYLSTAFLLAGIAAKIATNYILVAKPKININGAIIGNMICFIIPLILNSMVIRKGLKFRVSLFNHFISPFISSLFMSAAAYLFYINMHFISGKFMGGYLSNAISLMVSIVIGAYVYLFGLALTGGIKNKDLESMPSRLKKLIPKRIINRIKAN